MWMPAKLSTFILPVVEIEMIVKKLKISLNQTSNPILAQSLANWLTILDTYRYQTSLTNMFNSADAVLNQAITTLSKMFTDGTLSLEDVLTDTSIDKAGHSGLIDTYSRFSSSCMDLKAYASTQHLCNHFNPSDWTSILDVIGKGACNIPQSFLSNSTGGFALLQSVCMVGSGQGSQSLYSFLDGVTDLTFGSNTPIKLSYTSKTSTSLTLQSNFNALDSVDEGGYVDWGTFSIKNSASHMSLSRGSALTHYASFDSMSDHSVTQGVTINLEDSDNGDYFGILIQEDVTYGTPMFTTLGGQSMCPAETGTLAREGSVKIVDIIPRCGPYADSACTNLPSGETAFFSIRILNLSPTRKTEI
jgi:hypothetical protein